MGSEMCIRDRDVVTVLGFAIFDGLILIVANLAVDVLYAVVDPRVRLS